MARCMVSPNSAGLWATRDAGGLQGGDLLGGRALCRRRMIAPAWPIRLPGGAVRPAMNAATGFVTCWPMKAAASSSPSRRFRRS